MRLRLFIEERLVDDTGIVLETLGFVPDETQPNEPAKDGVIPIVGDLPDGSLSELQAVAGVRDWNVLPADAPEPREWPWSQQPETD